MLFEPLLPSSPSSASVVAAARSPSSLAIIATVRVVAIVAGTLLQLMFFLLIPLLQRRCFFSRGTAPTLVNRPLAIREPSPARSLSIAHVRG